MKSKNMIALTAMLLMFTQTVFAESFGGFEVWKPRAERADIKGETTVWEVKCKGSNGVEHTQRVRVTADSRGEANAMVTKEMMDTMFCQDRYNISLSVVE